MRTTVNGDFRLNLLEFAVVYPDRQIGVDLTRSE
jgi:hypothetical protein